MLGGLDASEIVACLPEVRRVGVEIEGAHHPNHTRRGFGDGIVADEEVLPNDVGLIHFGGGVELGRRDRGEAHHLADEVVIGQEFVDAGQGHVERGLVQVSVNIENRN